MMDGKKISWKYKSQKGSSHVLKKVSFELKKGRIATFIGPSGAGKTTLLKCMGNLHSHYEGIITCNGRDIKNFSPVERASTIGFVLQQFHLFPHLSVLKNCTYALENAMGMKEREAEERAVEILEALNMQPFIHSFPSHLSGGQQQRVAIARALVLRPEILLLDEPTSALDPDSKKSLECLLLDLSSRGITLALSSHDMPFIRKIMDRVYFMEQGELIEEWDREKDDLSSKEKIKQFLAHI
jgi:ABC-type polar amino acid transport system ATPase subunit